jgi:hypothetical protein
VLSYADSVYGLLDGPCNMVAYEGGGFLLTDSNNNQVKLVRDINGDGDALDLGEVVLFADGINAPVDIVALTLGLPGDYNGDNVVNAADYIVWRKTDGAPAGYNAWRANFGATASSGTGAMVGAAVPEPATPVILLLEMLLMCARRRGAES